MGIDPATLPGTHRDQDGVWPEHVAALEAFLSVQHQWRLSGSGRVLGLDYASVRAGFDLAGIEMTPDLWSDVQLIERGACAALNGD